MIGLLVRGAVYLARTVEYAVQAGRSFIVSFVGLLPLTGFGATESGVDCGVIGVVVIASAFVPIALELASAIFWPQRGLSRWLCCYYGPANCPLPRKSGS